MEKLESINIYDIKNYDCIEYDIDKEEEYLRKRILQNNLRQINRLNYYFKWKSEEAEGLQKITIPRNVEIILRVTGLMCFLKDQKKFAIAQAVNFDGDNEPTLINAITLGTEDKQSYTLTKEQCILLFNNAIGSSDLPEIKFMAYEKAQTDISRMYQLINSRLIPLLETDSDKAMQQIKKMINDVKAGKPGIVMTSIMDEVKKLDYLDPNAIAKMEYLTGYDEILDKHVANRFGASLDSKDKKAQVTTEELKAYDDLTTADYLANYEPRIEFCEKMKEAGFAIECVPNPIFKEEPTAEEIEDPDLLDEPEENSDEGEKKKPDEEEEEGGADNEN